MGIQAHIPDEGKVEDGQHLSTSASEYCTRIKGVRWIVMLAVGYRDPDAPTPEDAALAALELTRDGDQAETKWLVLDRQTGEVKVLEQSEFDDHFAAEPEREKP